MRLPSRESLRLSGSLVANVGVQGGAMLSLAVATILVAHLDGPGGVGALALLRLLPWLVAVVVSAGLPGACAYFLAGPSRSDPRLAPTIVAMLAVAGAAGMLAWVAAAPAVRLLLLPAWSTALVAAAAPRVATRLVVIVTKACAQGMLDPAGTSRVILLEELSFLPAYAVAWALGLRGGTALIAGLVLADVLTMAASGPRLLRRGFWRGAGRPALGLAGRIAGFGARAQLSNLVTLLNLRLDFLLVGALAGAAPLGTYAVASRFAELLRLPAIAVYWVLSPRFARAAPAQARWRARRLIPQLGALTVLGAVPLALSAPLVIPLLYGRAFAGGVLAAQVLLVGLAADGFGGVVNAYLYGTGRPGLASIATAAGLAVTGILDVALIPGHGILGAAVASTCAYLAATGALLACFRLTTARPRRAGAVEVPAEVHRA